ncbi:hypothetical protein [Corynebacterium sp.]|uniref:hypothetical protein n=1 Tax=Corynebacterium sp. TaxID=1720 RepID=UPI0026DD1216|nr:hypothetical protein [Corynebacterium sp.]MDO5075941.1 hypothetical protein [Corynebacterium sp.]
MSTVVSATFHRAPGRAEDFLSRAHGLLQQAHNHLRAGDVLLAVDYGYQACLRAAGARGVDTRGRGKAWDKLQRIDAAGAAQAAQFRPWAPVRARAAAGLAITKTPAEVANFLGRVSYFIEEIEGGLPLVA